MLPNECDVYRYFEPVKERCDGPSAQGDDWIPNQAASLNRVISELPSKSDKLPGPNVLYGGIEEDVVKHHYSDPIVPTINSHSSRAGHRKDTSRDSPTIGIHSSRTSAHSDPLSPLSTPPSPGSTSTSKPQRPKIRWSWSQPLLTGNEDRRTPSSQDETSSVKSYFGWSTQPERCPSPLIALKPPARSPITPLAPENENRVVVEQSFDEQQILDTQPTVALKKAKPKSRRTSIDPKRIFSTPLNVFRRFSRDRQRAKYDPGLGNDHTPISSADVLDHRSLLKRQQTGAVLNRVSTLLENMRSPKSKKLRVRTMSNMSMSSHCSKRTNAAQTPTSASWTSRLNDNIDPSGNDFSDARSLSSSIIRLKMGHTPKTTPKEGATYKIKRSPSAETEEFFKIDISIRGETNYLPSEARRIHTPPLPEYGRQGLRRGFFFDYNAPHTEHSGSINNFRKPDPQDEFRLNYVRAQQRSSSQPSYKASDTRRMNATNHNDSTVQPVTTGKAFDWYDMQLAKLDSICPQETAWEVETSETAMHSLVVNIATEERKYENMLDYNIPEHLPSSPLCPRNPKYWRVVQNRGSQFRGCWMHGYGIAQSDGVVEW